MKTKYFLLTCLTWMTITAAAQQPFKQYGYQVKISTLSQGEFVEDFTTDSLVQVGSVVLNRVTGKIVSFITYDTSYSEATLDPQLISRWMSPDPLAEKYFSWSPYNFVLNNPILFIDPDGRDVSVSNLNQAHQQAFYQFAQTKEGVQFLKQFARSHTVIYLEKINQIVDLSGDRDGKYANDVIEYSSEKMAAGGTTLMYAKNSKSGSSFERVDELQSSELPDGPLRLHTQISINQNKDSKEATFTIGHESIVHGQENYNKLERLKGKSYASLDEFVSDLTKNINNANQDHRKDASGNVQQMKGYIQSLDKVFGTDYYSKLYEKEKERANPDNK